MLPPSSLCLWKMEHPREPACAGYLVTAASEPELWLQFEVQVICGDEVLVQERWEDRERALTRLAEYQQAFVKEGWVRV